LRLLLSRLIVLPISPDPRGGASLFPEGAAFSLAGVAQVIDWQPGSESGKSSGGWNLRRSTEPFAVFDEDLMKTEVDPKEGVLPGEN
jgi:hypothetical protein